MNSTNPLPSLQYIIQTRWYGGQIECLPRYADDRQEDNLYLARIPIFSQVEVLMKVMLEEIAQRHVHEDIRLSPIDEPRHYLFATYSGSTDFLKITADKPHVGASGVIATLGSRLVFCQDKNTFPVVGGMCFWGWVGMKHRVVWKQYNGILRDTNGRSALPHDAGEEATECWKRLAGDGLKEDSLSRLGQQLAPQGRRFIHGFDPVPITAQILEDPWVLFDKVPSNL